MATDDYEDEDDDDDDGDEDPGQDDDNQVDLATANLFYNPTVPRGQCTLEAWISSAFVQYIIAPRGQ